jgi:hypothetical protein
MKGILLLRKSRRSINRKLYFLMGSFSIGMVRVSESIWSERLVAFGVDFLKLKRIK